MRMSKGVIGVNALFAIASALAAVQIGRALLGPDPPAPSEARQALLPGAKAAGAPALFRPSEPHQPLGSYAVISTRNLFSPTRSENAVASNAPPQPPPGPKPALYGVVLRDDLSIAYLEDPASKRVAGYRVGDAIAGGTVEAIAPDHVVLRRAEGAVQIRLQDPQKPRAAAAEANPPAAQGGPTTVGPPGTAGAPPLGLPFVGGPRPIRSREIRRLPAPPAIPVPPPTPDDSDN